MRLAVTPYFAFGGRPFREARVISYVVGEHRRGRAVTDVLDDPYVHRLFGHDSHRLLTNPRLVEALRRDVLDQLGHTQPTNGDRAPAEPQTKRSLGSIVEMVANLARQ